MLILALTSKTTLWLHTWVWLKNGLRFRDHNDYTCLSLVKVASSFALRGSRVSMENPSLSSMIFQIRTSIYNGFSIATFACWRMLHFIPMFCALNPIESLPSLEKNKHCHRNPRRPRGGEYFSKAFLQGGKFLWRHLQKMT